MKKQSLQVYAFYIYHEHKKKVVNLSSIVICEPHQPGPLDNIVQPESNEDELQYIHRTQHLQLRRKEITRSHCKNLLLQKDTHHGL